MSFWSYCAPLRLTLSMIDFCAVYFMTLLGRCAMVSLPVLGVILLLRKTALRRSTFAKGAVWAIMLPVLLVGRLSVYYSGSKLYLPLLLWQSWCSGYWWVRYGYLAGVIVGLAVMIYRRRKLHRLLRGLPTERIDGQTVYLSPLTVSPFTAGILHPKIVLPTLAREQLDDSELRTVLLHERTHIRLGHLWYFSLWEVLCALLWVNPFLRLVMPKLKEDMEQVCDAVTIQRRGGDALAYGGVLLKSMTLLRDTSVSLPIAFAGEKDFADAKRRMRRVRDYRPYSQRRVRALAVSTACLLLLAVLTIHGISLPRYTNLTGFSILHVSEDIRFTTVYESETEEPPLTLNGDVAELDCIAFRSLLPDDAPQDGYYYIMWDGFMKLPGIGGALNSIWVDAGAEGSTASVAFQDINDQFYVKLAKWI
ncbi:MAG: M56 family metallopeptidase [Oscillospiraceae bacterium]|nr:M56 family metallopeptidase [Oscillospiraceae bacterium]